MPTAEYKFAHTLSFIIDNKMFKHYFKNMRIDPKNMVRIIIIIIFETFVSSLKNNVLWILSHLKSNQRTILFDEWQFNFFFGP